jgi:cell division protein ZapA
MAEVLISIGGHSYQLSCRDGEEAHLHKIANIVDGKISEARAAVGDLGEVRQLLLASLLLADELHDMSKPAAAGKAPAGDAEAAAIEMLAERVEAIAAKLEKAN